MKAWIESGWSALLGLVKILGPGKEISREQRTPDHRILSLYSAGSEGRGALELSTKFREIFTILLECTFYGLPFYKDTICEIGGSTQ